MLDYFCFVSRPLCLSDPACARFRTTFAYSRTGDSGATCCARVGIGACVFDGVCKPAQDGRTALICVADGGLEDCVRLLLDAGANKNAKEVVRVFVCSLSVA